METNDLAAIGYASQALAFAVLSALFLGWRRVSPFSPYLGAASVASSVSGCILTLQALQIISFGAVLVLAEGAKSVLWIVALLMILRALDTQRLAEKHTRRYVLPVLIAAFAGLLLFSTRKFDSFSVSLVVSGGIRAPFSPASLNRPSSEQHRWGRKTDSQCRRRRSLAPH